jgi:hypothetical protein
LEAGGQFVLASGLAILVASLTHRTVARKQEPADDVTDGPLPLWALIALGAGVAGIGARRLNAAG